MDTIVQFFFDHAPHAHWIVFGALMLAGLNVPISEDVMIIVSAVLAATVVPENTAHLFLGVFLGCYLSDWVSYWIGRKFGPKLLSIKWFAKTVSQKRLAAIHNYYEKYGFWTLVIGRFIPFGVRNCLFLSAGVGKMHFGKFLLSDGIACILSNSILFTLAYHAGKNYEALLQFVKTFNISLFVLFLVSIIGVIWYKGRTSRSKDRPIE
jgi:membrane protein DedA with SNARE-associated domain